MPVRDTPAATPPRLGPYETAYDTLRGYDREAPPSVRPEAPRAVAAARDERPPRRRRR